MSYRRRFFKAKIFLFWSIVGGPKVNKALKSRCSVRLIVSLLIGLSLGTSTIASAFILESWKLPNGKLDYKINTSSFSNLGGLSINSTQAKYWVQTAISRWVSQTGVDIGVDYQGTTTASCLSGGDGINTIEVLPTSNGSILATTFTTYNSSTGLTSEWDICIYGAGANFEAATSKVATSETHILPLLVHEFGHVLGLDDIPAATPGGVMHGNIQPGNNGNYLLRDDIRALRDRYPALRGAGLSSYWRELGASSWGGWGPRHTISNTKYYRPVRATIGKVAGVSKVIGTGLVDNPNSLNANKIRFFATDYPLGSSGVTVWNTEEYTHIATDSPAIAADNNGTFLAAVPMATTISGYGCSGMKFYRSTTGFQTAYTYINSNMCSLVSPTIAWNNLRQRWFIVWVDYDPTIEENTGRMMYSSSADGTNWSTTRSLGRFSNATPGLACNTTGGCLLTYVRASDFSPNVVARNVSFNSAGIISLGGYTEHQDYIQREVSAAVTQNGSWLHAWSYSSSGDWKSHGWGNLYSSGSQSSPPTGSSLPVFEGAEHSGSLAATKYYGNEYLFYVD